MQKSYIRALASGLGIMIFALILDASKVAAWPLLYFLFFCPGFIFGRVLVNGQNISYGRKLLFIIISGLSYILCFWITDIMRENDKILGSLKLLGASCVGSVLLSVSYLLLFKTGKSFYFILLSLVLAGILSAVPSAVFIYLFQTVNHYRNGFSEGFNLIEFGLMAGIFTIYPLWQTAFVWVVNMKKFKTVADLTVIAA